MIHHSLTKSLFLGWLPRRPRGLRRPVRRAAEGFRGGSGARGERRRCADRSQGSRHDRLVELAHRQPRPLHDEDGRHRRTAITKGDEVDWFPRFSPDGSKILFSRSKKGWVSERDANDSDKWDVYTVSPDGSTS